MLNLPIMIDIFSSSDSSNSNEGSFTRVFRLSVRYLSIKGIHITIKKSVLGLHLMETISYGPYHMVHMVSYRPYDIVHIITLIMNPKSMASTGSNSMHTPLIVVILLQNFRQSICSNLQCEMKYLN